MSELDPLATFTEADEGDSNCQKALLSGIQYSFYVALGMNIVALLILVFSLNV